MYLLRSILQGIVLVAVFGVYAGSPAVTCVEHWHTSAQQSHQHWNELMRKADPAVPRSDRSPQPPASMPAPFLPECRLEAPHDKSPLLLTISDPFFLPDALDEAIAEQL